MGFTVSPAQGELQSLLTEGHFLCSAHHDDWQQLSYALIMYWSLVIHTWDVFLQRSAKCTPYIEYSS